MLTNEMTICFDMFVAFMKTVGCFLHFHGMGEVPKNIYHPVVDYLVSEHHARSASAYA